ncbi:histamine N-methyltransferase-like [Acropora millepora]|uniref:histamine N-methyltransferase-like n=1 Tax=Acropora millepora TaxID=45264 RepID=UPI0010FCD9C0|nr:histamine N-methyltransferase-like [Acropora millepora]
MEISGGHYIDSFKLFETKSNQLRKTEEMLRERLPSLVPRRLHDSQQLNILSVGSGNGEKDFLVLKVIRESLRSNDNGTEVKIFNRGIEPNTYFCDLYNEAIETMLTPSDDQATEFEICEQSFQEYSQHTEKYPVKFDVVHFIHSIYYLDMKEALCHCFEKELGENGVFVCIVSGLDLINLVLAKQPTNGYGQKDGAIENLEKAGQLVEIAKSKGWKHEVYMNEYSIDVTEVFDPKSTEGNLLLDFLTHTINFRETAEKQVVEETLAVVRDHTVFKDGKRLGKKKDWLIALYK